MAVQQLHDGGADGVNVGQSSSSLVGFHGVSAVDQASAITLATNATIGTVRTAVRSILTMLTEKGLIAGGP